MQKSRLRSGAHGPIVFPAVSRSFYTGSKNEKSQSISLQSIWCVVRVHLQHASLTSMNLAQKECTLFEIGRKKCLLFSAIKKLWQGTSVSVLLTWHQVNENITLCCNTDSLSAKIVNLTPPQFTYLPFVSFILSQGLSFFNSPGIIIRQVPFSFFERLSSFFVLV